MAEPFVGLISDTHGLMRPEALQALQGASQIIHAGDVGPESILTTLRNLAPVTAVRGNVDREPWCRSLPESAELQFEGHWLHVRHIIDELDLEPATAGFSAVIFGHSHRPEIRERRGVAFVNPGSAGPRRFKLPISVARLYCRDSKIVPELIELEL